MLPNKRYPTSSKLMHQMYRKYVPNIMDDSLSLYEQMIAVIEHINNVVKTSDKLSDEVSADMNELIAEVNNIREFAMPENVIKVLTEWQESGFLDVVINDALQWELDEYKAINEQDKLSLTAQLQQTETEIKRINENIVDAEKFRYDQNNVYKSDTDTIKSALTYAYDNSKELHLFRDYTITPIVIDKPVIIEGHDNKLIASGSGNILIEIVDGVTVHLNHLYVDATGYNIGVRNTSSYLYIYYVTVANAIECNVRYLTVELLGSGTIRNLFTEFSEIGLDLNAHDVKVDRVQAKLCRTSIRAKGGGIFLSNCHGWVFGDSVDNSVFLDLHSSITAVNSYADTQETAINLPTTDQWALVNIVNFVYFLNRSTYPSTRNAPKLLRNVDTFPGQFSIMNIHADNASWRDAEGNPTNLYDGTLNSARMSINGLTNNGFLDKDNLLSKKGDLLPYVSDVMNEYISVYSQKFFKHHNITKISIKGSLKKAIPVGVEVYSSTLSTPLNTLDLSTQGRVFIKNGNILHNLSWFVEDGNITIINDTSSSISGGTFCLFLEHYKE